MVFPMLKRFDKLRLLTQQSPDVSFNRCVGKAGGSRPAPKKKTPCGKRNRTRQSLLPNRMLRNRCQPLSPAWRWSGVSG